MNIQETIQENCWVGFRVRATGPYGNYTVNGALNGFFQRPPQLGERFLVRFRGTGKTAVATVVQTMSPRVTNATNLWSLANSSGVLEDFEPYEEEPELDIDLDK